MMSTQNADNSATLPLPGSTSPESEDLKDTAKRGRMPASVVIAAMIIASLMTCSLVLRVVPASLVGVILAGVILAGLIKGHALAWQWGRIIPVISGIAVSMNALVALSDLRRDSRQMPIFLATLAIAAMLFAIPRLLGTKNARLFFGLRCPRCESTKVKAGNFLF
ncbi:MAG: hypothetical protein JRH20_24190, partial [Deltaproteobacteria bacterium]|nr:hypothetical protein [Deltaproteobacteria bacterium]